MCLLDSVEDWDDLTICCRTSSHRDPCNPLRFGGRLTVAAGLEYAAQAMGAHVGLVGGLQQGAYRVGLVGSVREVVFSADRLDDLEGPLLVNATRLVEAELGYMYEFIVAHGALKLIEGRASIFLKATA
jgi:predicted hotdog family 3-hydroxylacyl-ACP dehydratase